MTWGEFRRALIWMALGAGCAFLVLDGHSGLACLTFICGCIVL